MFFEKRDLNELIIYVGMMLQFFNNHPLFRELGYISNIFSKEVNIMDDYIKSNKMNMGHFNLKFRIKY
jgi:hypothetical protein